jgi:hypothetical protein
VDSLQWRAGSRRGDGRASLPMKTGIRPARESGADLRIPHLVGISLKAGHCSNRRILCFRRAREHSAPDFVSFCRTIAAEPETPVGTSLHRHSDSRADKHPASEPFVLSEDMGFLLSIRMWHRVVGTSRCSTVPFGFAGAYSLHISAITSGEINGTGNH